MALNLTQFMIGGSAGFWSWIITSNGAGVFKPKKPLLISNGT